MSMDDAFKKVIQGVRQVDEGRNEIIRGLEQAFNLYGSLKESIGELQEHVTSLETLVQELAKEVKDLKNSK